MYLLAVRSVNSIAPLSCCAFSHGNHWPWARDAPNTEISARFRCNRSVVGQLEAPFNAFNATNNGL